MGYGSHGLVSLFSIFALAIVPLECKKNFPCCLNFRLKIPHLFESEVILGMCSKVVNQLINYLRSLRDWDYYEVG